MLKSCNNCAIMWEPGHIPPVCVRCRRLSNWRPNVIDIDYSDLEKRVMELCATFRWSPYWVMPDGFQVNVDKLDTGMNKPWPATQSVPLQGSLRYMEEVCLNSGYQVSDALQFFPLKEDKGYA